MNVIYIVACLLLYELMLIVFFHLVFFLLILPVNESTNESALTKSAETEVAQAPKANNGIGGVIGGGGKGIGMFAKKRSASAAPPSKVTTSINANANVNGAGQKFSPIRNTNAVMNNNSVVAAVEN